MGQLPIGDVLTRLRVVRARRTRTLLRCAFTLLALALLSMGVLLASSSAARAAVTRTAVSVAHHTSITTNAALSTSNTSTAGAFTVVGLGDSVESGYNCTGCTTLVSSVANTLAGEQGRSATIDNLATEGFTTDNVVDQLTRSSVRQTIADSDLVIIEIGANDLDESIIAQSQCSSDPAGTCYLSTFNALQTKLTSIVTQVKELQTKSDAQVVIMGYWNVFEDGSVGAENGSAYVGNSNTLTTQFNTLVAKIARANAVIYADAYTPFKGSDGTQDDTSYLASDGDHPNQVGQNLLASAVLKSL